MMKKIRLISLSASKLLAKRIAAQLDLDICETSTIKFLDGEMFFNCNSDLSETDVVIIQSTCSPSNDNLFELMCAVDVAKRSKANSITCVVPYFGYARQDKVAHLGQSLASEMVANTLYNLGATNIICCDIHSNNLKNKFCDRFESINTAEVFAEYFSKICAEDLVCVAPDHGSIKRTSELAKELGVKVVEIEKIRPDFDRSEIVSVTGDVNNKVCIIFDDVTSTAGTLCNAANEIKKLGASKVYACVSHGVLAGNAIYKIENSAIEKLIVSNTITMHKTSNKIEVVDVSHILSRKIKEILGL